MKLFSEFRSCYRPQNTPPSTTAAPPSDDDEQQQQRSRVHRSHWRPSLSVIVEDSMDQDHRDNVAKKSQKKSFAKPRSSSLNSSCSFLTENRTRNSLPPVIIIAPFSATPYLF
ncbi:Threonine synthase-like [Senna tora]|uniref:Threonine synthase-like n=1 Tax=Senna tora TaxID=362788 RepID=A0A834TKP9_9FABA|nr:Threonine synthase-like [Senna tora]